MSAFDIVFAVVLGLGTIWAMIWFPDIPRGTEGHHEALTARFEKSAAAPPEAIDQHPTYGDAAVAYVDRIIDRQLTKVRGILAFDGLILTFLGLISRGAAMLDIADHHEVPVLSLMALLAASSAICLFQFRARWGYVADLQTFSREIAATLALARRRSFWIERTVRLSILALAGIVVLLIAALAGN
ncbi:hypothetical protein [Sphingomonas bacterium]|uniref:hypothetical protein n=1 Tax=Sphingomonas bacterium TaxID=1895847 RepID=UPI0026170763|nr:hypothetical protein [Sphingomonas bacterium]MDB5679760.1 hypothetical protein [Sphingomonas bacterium]